MKYTGLTYPHLHNKIVDVIWIKEHAAIIRYDGKEYGVSAGNLKPLEV